ncbi:uncharacterized protein LOC135833660 [Planococcus citri]|uniref:uncharacterized protein LOC135833660 n=1 Tax=Planococcus citri TaxID=170843 RepID=UPI0031F88631
MSSPTNVNAGMDTSIEKKFSYPPELSESDFKDKESWLRYVAEVDHLLGKLDSNKQEDLNLSLKNQISKYEATIDVLKNQLNEQQILMRSRLASWWINVIEILNRSVIRIVQKYNESKI